MRLIDVEELNKELKLKKRILTARYGEYASESGSYMSWKEVFDMINGAPTVDAVPVVRCEDCKFGEKGRIFDSDCIWCGVDHNQAKSMRFYCASGERREDDGED